MLNVSFVYLIGAAMDISVCEPVEWGDFIDIFIEMETYHNKNLTLSREDMARYLNDKVFPANSGTQVHKVVCDDRIVAFACISILHPSPRFSGQMFIKELFVSETFRGMGIGRRLMSHIAKTAQEKECLMLDWLSVKTDKRVQDFYHSVGAKVVDGVNYHRLFGQAISDLAKADD